jgi:hypothetical protein
MAHIRQKINLLKNKTISDVYTVVITDGYNDLNTHPSIVEHPDFFEIITTDLPQEYQLLNYDG